MIRSASYAPHLGAALAAALMMAAALAYSLGERSAPSALEAETAAEQNQSDETSTALDSDLSMRSQGALLMNWLSEQTESETVKPLNGSGVDARGEGQGEAELQPVLRPPDPRPQLVVIMDDVGLDIQAAQSLMELGVPITLAILPYAEAAPDLAKQARQGGLEVFLHMPMEPVGIEDPGPYALTGALSEEELRARLNWAFSRVPGAVGFNNHMGSRMTADRRQMDQVFAALDAIFSGSDDLMFVDSITHPRSHAQRAASAAGLQALSRDVFLDHEPDQAAVSEQLNRALALALQNGQAIAIGHPRSQTLAVLQDLQRRADAVGVELTTVRALVERSERPDESVQAVQSAQ